MRDFLFTEFIHVQWNEFVILFFTGTAIFTLYRVLRKYLFVRIASIWVAALLELLFFAAAGLFTGGIVDYCCNAAFTFYMGVAFFFGILASRILVQMKP